MRVRNCTETRSLCRRTPAEALLFDQDESHDAFTTGTDFSTRDMDMATYLRAHLTDTMYFYLTQQPTFKYTEYNTAGLGWAWYSHENIKFVDATGGTGGYSCCVIFERCTGTGIVLLTYVSAFLASKGDYIVKMARALYDPVVASRERSTAESRKQGHAPVP